MLGFVFALAFAVVILVILSKGPSTISSRPPCVKKPHLKCTVETTYHGRGFSAKGHSGCCKVRDQIKGMNRMFANMEPGQDYSGISCTRNVHEQAKRDFERAQKIDSDGPAW